MCTDGTIAANLTDTSGANRPKMPYHVAAVTVCGRGGAVGSSEQVTSPLTEIRMSARHRKTAFRTRLVALLVVVSGASAPGVAAGVAVSAGAAATTTTTTAKDSNWPQWRGPLANGAAPTAEPPLTWGEGK